MSASSCSVAVRSEGVDDCLSGELPTREFWSGLSEEPRDISGANSLTEGGGKGMLDLFIYSGCLVVL